jgi:hypothetical protein
MQISAFVGADCISNLTSCIVATKITQRSGYTSAVGAVEIASLRKYHPNYSPNDRASHRTRESSAALLLETQESARPNN